MLDSLSIYSLWRREMIRFYRQPSRIVGAIGSPLMFWLLLGSGIGASFRSESGTYLHYFFPGVILMILLFTSIFSTISLIEDRREGFMQSVMAAPVSRESLVLGKILGGATLAWIQGSLFLIFAPMLGVSISFKSWLCIEGILFLNAFALTALGFGIAWRFRSIQGFHAVMNLFLMPLWILSGALFPKAGAAVWIQVIMTLNPTTYGLAALRNLLFSAHSTEIPLGLSITVLSVFALILFFWAVITAKSKRHELLV